MQFRYDYAYRGYSGHQGYPPEDHEAELHSGPGAAAVSRLLDLPLGFSNFLKHLFYLGPHRLICGGFRVYSPCHGSGWGRRHYWRLRSFPAFHILLIRHPGAVG